MCVAYSTLSQRTPGLSGGHSPLLRYNREAGQNYVSLYTQADRSAERDGGHDCVLAVPEGKGSVKEEVLLTLGRAGVAQSHFLPQCCWVGEIDV